MDNAKEIDVKLVGLGDGYKDKTTRVEKDDFLIGRARDCDLRLEENTISGRHAKILKVQDHYEIEDLQSTNGTFLNGVRVSRKRLRSGDKIKFDQFEFLFIDPADVSRTMVATPSLMAEAQRTIARPGAAPAVPLSTAAKTGKGSLFGGAVVASLMTFLVGLVGNVILQQALIAGSGGSFLGSFFENLKSMARIYPRMHQAHLWPGADFTRWQEIVSVLLIVASVLLGGILVQSIGRRSRPASALAHSFVFVLAALVLQFALIQFSFQTLPILYSGLISDLSPWPSFVLGVAYIFGVVFILSLVGTLFVRRSR